MDARGLVGLIKSPSATTRFYAQQEILNRPVDPATVKPLLTTIIREKSLPLESRAAALFTLSQIESDPAEILAFAADESLCEFALRAATDRLPRLKNTSLPLAPFTQILQIGTPRQRAAAAIALGRLGNPDAAATLLEIPFIKPSGSQLSHATPNPSILLPHLAAQALNRLQAADACLAAIGTSSEDLALWALSNMHSEQVVDGLLAMLKETTSPQARKKILTTLARLYHEETPFDGTTWWTTRPDTRGPHYKPVTWSCSARIAAALEAESSHPGQSEFLARLNDSHRLDLVKLGTRQTAATTEKPPTVDLAKIASLQGAVATTPIEDIILSLDKLKPNNERGKQLFTQQGCVACHSLEADGPALGPFMGQVGSIMTPDQIATAILRPSDSISQGFQSIMLTMKDGTVRTGFASETTAEKIFLRDPSGAVTTIATADVKEEKHLNTSMMPEGLANSLSLDDSAALVHFLASKK